MKTAAKQVMQVDNKYLLFDGKKNKVAFSIAFIYCSD